MTYNKEIFYSKHFTIFKCKVAYFFKTLKLIKIFNNQ